MDISSRDLSHTAGFALDLEKIRPGDEVTVRMTVLAKDGSSLRIGRPGDNNAWAWSNRWEVVSHTPKALAVGDRVKVGDGKDGDYLWKGRVVRLVAIDGGAAWVASEACDHLTVSLERLERADV